MRFKKTISERKSFLAQDCDPDAGSAFLGVILYENDALPSEQILARSSL